MKRLITLFFVAAGWLSMVGPASAQTEASASDPSKIPAQDFARYPKYSELRLSPDGSHLAALVPVENHYQLLVLDLATKTGQLITRFPDLDVRGVAWVNNRRLVYSLWDHTSGRGEQDGGGLFAVDLDATSPRELAPTVVNMERSGDVIGRGMEFLGRDYQHDSDKIFVESNARDVKHADVFLIDTRTGRKELLTFDAPRGVEEWVLDRAGVPRAAVAEEKGRTLIYYREDATSPWQTLAEFPLETTDSWKPVGFDGDGKTMYVASNVGRDTRAIFKYDFVNKRVGLEPVLESPQFDVEEVVYDHTKNKVVGIRYDADRETTVWSDPDWITWQATLDKALPNHVNTILNVTTAGTLLVDSASDIDPGRYYLFDTRARKIEELVNPLPWIRPSQMSAMRFVTYKARDGMVIPALLTLPKNADGKKVPLIMYVHGGPYLRGATWGYNPEVQFLASRGYAVLQPEYRGSTGFGKRLFKGGWKTWGLAMQDDLSDGVSWAVAQGLVDPGRVCIYGASYGGYAVMMGLAKDPEEYRCGVNYAGVTDINLMYDVTWSDTADTDWQKYSMPTMIGDPDKDAAQLKATSPIRQASHINKPVLMAYGGLDVRVPIVHGEQMRDALKANGTPVEWVVYSEEAHGWTKEVNQVDFYTRVDKFLARYLAGGS